MKVLEALMSPKAVPAPEKLSAYWRHGAKATLKNKLKETINKNKAKNGIFFIGDGMSVATIMAARTYLGQLQKKPGEEQSLSFERFPVTGLAKVTLK